MTTPSDPAGTNSVQSTTAYALRAAADFIESSGVRGGVTVTCGGGRVQIRVSAPYGDTAARQAAVTRLARLIGGKVQRHDEREFPSADLRAAGTVSGVPAMVSTNLAVRREGPPEEPGRPFAVVPGGRPETVSGRLPDGWRWVTALDPDPWPTSAREQREATPALTAASAPVLAARDCPPLNGTALRSATQQRQGTATHPVRHASPACRVLA